MKDTIIDAVVRQVKEDLHYNDTEALEEMLKLLYSKNNHEIMKNYFPEETWEDYKDYEELD